MTRSMTKVLLALAVAVTATLAVAVGSAAAHGGPGHGGKGFGGASTTKLVNAGAKELGVTNAAIRAAIVKSANARVDDALADGDITAGQAADIKDEAADNLNVAYGLSRASTVASALGVTATKLNDAFRAARKALALANIDAALAAGRITAEQAAAAKTQLNSATLPGYKQGLGIGGPGGGPHGGHGR